MKHLMPSRFSFLALVILIFGIETLYGFSLLSNCGGHRLLLGPEVYYAKRTKKGGSKQTGWMYGGRLRYERLCPWSFYWAVDGLYAYGCVDGKTGSGSKIKSDLTDAQIEGRLGYTVIFQCLRNLMITLYGGYGYFHGKNCFIDPSPIELRFHNHFQYGAGGILTSVCLSDCLEAGIDFKAKSPFDAKSKVTNDPVYDSVTLNMNNKLQYEVDIPVRYTTCWCDRRIELSFVPFYRFRHYGGMPNFPFDFVDTKFHLYGGRILLDLTF